MMIVILKICFEQNEKKTEKGDVSKNVVLIFGIGCESVNKVSLKLATQDHLWKRIIILIDIIIVVITINNNE
jgi:hypothetical protein